MLESELAQPPQSSASSPNMQSWLYPVLCEGPPMLCYVGLSGLRDTWICGSTENLKPISWPTVSTYLRKSL